MMSYIYEIETRFHFSTEKEIYQKLPFLKSYLELEVKWKTDHYGEKLFKKDYVLRISQSNVKGAKIVSLGYKEPDFGQKINIRKEYSEKIADIIQNSEILQILEGKKSLKNKILLAKELERLGYEKFMSFNGYSLLGKYDPLNLKLKIMHCRDLQFPLLLEIEKEAEMKEEIKDKEKSILNFIEEYDLKDKLIKKEPPTLLYEKT